MDLVHPEVDRYLHDLSRSTDPVLLEMEQLAAERSFPIVGPLVGRLFNVLAASIGARRVLELGSGFGYSAYWFCRAVGPGGLVILTEGSPERAAEAGTFLERAGFADRIRIEVGDALEIAERIGGEFDIVFNDIDKQDYPKVLPLAAALLRPRGLFLSDNMLWRGTVLQKEPSEATTRGVMELTRRLYASDDFHASLVPLRDGVSVAVRRDEATKG